jgi:hypothetical protein
MRRSCVQSSAPWSQEFKFIPTGSIAALRLNAKTDKPQPAHFGGNDPERYLTVLTIPARLKRTGIEMRMVVEDGSEPANVDPVVLVRLLLWAHAIRARLLEEPSLPLTEIAAEEGISSSYVTRLLRLAFLAPDIVTAILNGRHPPQLTANRLMDNTRLPLDWTAQLSRSVTKRPIWFGIFAATIPSCYG